MRSVILQAADSIEKFPDLFQFTSLDTPAPPEDGDCGTPGCALGWIAFHMGIKQTSALNGWSQSGEVYKALGIKEDCCFPELVTIDEYWARSPEHCARALRIFADLNFPAGRDNIPAKIRAIFEEKVDGVTS